MLNMNNILGALQNAQGSQGSGLADIAGGVLSSSGLGDQLSGGLADALSGSGGLGGGLGGGLAGALGGALGGGSSGGQDITAQLVNAFMTQSASAGQGQTGQMSALAMIGSLAFQAWQNHNRTAQTPGFVDQALPDASSPFMQARSDAASEEALGTAIVRAIIAAAKADGRIDEAEREAIFGQLDDMDLDTAEKAFVFDELSAPLDIDGVVALATGPEMASEIYAASLIAVNPDTAAEQAYLRTLASRMGLDANLVREIHRAAGRPLP